jgi:hypothetical protein
MLVLRAEQPGPEVMQMTVGCLDVPSGAHPAGHAQDTDVRIAVAVELFLKNL